jgi:cell division protein FtsN
MSTRDFKHYGTRRAEPLSLRDYKQFGLGLAIGLAVALYVWLQTPKEEAAIEPMADPVVSEPVTAADSDPAEQFDFYDMLPRFEVVVPETEHNPRRDQPSVAITKPGAYVLQVVSSRNRAEAERLRDRLAKMGITASIQQVIIDEQEWHRVRIGPSRDLDYINRMREQLRAADFTFIVYEVGE